MRKFYKLLSVLCVILFSLSFSGCTKFDSFTAGEYISVNEVENDTVSKIKLELYHIDRKTYSAANGVNVVRDFTRRSSADQYFSFNLYLFVNELGEYCKIDLSDFNRTQPTARYHCRPVDEDASYGVRYVAFEFRPSDVFISLDQNGTDTYYYLSLTTNIE